MNVNEILISMDSNWFIDRNKRQAIGYSGENAVVEFKLEATPEEGFTYYLDVQSKKIKNIILLDDELSVTLTTEMLGEAGIKKMQIVAYNETQVKKSNIFEVEVGESINATEEVEGHFASALNQISEWIAGVYRALTGKQNKLVPGTNIVIDESDPEHPVISSIGGGSGDDSVICPIYTRTGGSSTDFTDGTWTCNTTYSEIVSNCFLPENYKNLQPQFDFNNNKLERYLDIAQIKRFYVSGTNHYIEYVVRDTVTNGNGQNLYYVRHTNNDVITVTGVWKIKNQSELTSNNAGDGISIGLVNGVLKISVNYPNGDEVNY